MSWSVRRLKQFYDTKAGISAKNLIRESILQSIERYCKNEKVADAKIDIALFGYDIIDSDFPIYQSVEKVERKYDCIIGLHFEEIGISFNDVTTFAMCNLKENGIFIALTSNGNGFWSSKETPFCKYKTYKNIKSLKRINFKILNRHPILFSPLNFYNSSFRGACKILENVCSFILPTLAGAVIVTSKKQTEVINSTITKTIFSNENAVSV